jgi:predicted nuclease of restriction endonuclease-like RecB superfamily
LCNSILPSNLLVVWKRQGKIYPRYIKKTKNNIEIALNLIEVYKKSVGKKKQIIRDRINEFEEHNYRFIRGLSILLDRRSIYKCNSVFEPNKLRYEVFELTGKFGPATTTEKRNQILKEASKKLDLSIDKIENNIYADLDSELILISFNPLAPEELLELYNLSLTQTMLFDSIELRFTTSHNWQKIFFKTKKLGLIYEASKNGELWIKIDGPNSIFKLNRRYGSNISKLVPLILKSLNWKIEAKILWKYTNEIYSFRIDSINHKDLFRIQEVTEVYDSIVEADFGSRFQALKTKWDIKREPEPLIVNKHVMIPDFSFERDDVKVYMEVVGFWTTDYLIRKIKKLKEIKVNMLVAVDQNLACEALTQLKKRSSINILYYKKRIPLAPVLNFLKNSLKETHNKQTNFLKNLAINFTEPMVYFEEFAARIGVSVEAAREVIIQNPPENYIIWSKGLIRKEKVKQIKQKIDKKMKTKQKISLPVVTALLAEEGIDSTSVINSVGYKIIWRGLDLERAEVVKT